MSIMFVIMQRPAALTGHLSAARSTLQITAEQDFREALSPLPTPPRSAFTPHTPTSHLHESNEWNRNLILRPECLSTTLLYRNSGCTETEELHHQVVDRLWEDLNPLPLLVSPRTWLLLFPLSKTTGLMFQRKEQYLVCTALFSVP